MAVQTPSKAAAPHGSREDYPALTGLRGFAALAVFALHYASLYPLPRPQLWAGGPILDLPLYFAAGWIGVNIFFVLSGALLAPPFIRWRQANAPRPSLLAYWRRRLLRVVPAYWVQLFILALFGGWLAQYGWPKDIYSALSHWLMFFYLGPHPVVPVAEVWWTLPVELGFYLLLPVLAFGFGRHGYASWVVLMVIMLLLSMAYRYHMALAYSHLPNPQRVILIQQLPGRIMEFLAGVTAVMLLMRFSLAKRWRHPLLIAGVAIIVLWLWGIVRVGPKAYWDGHWWMLLAPLGFGLGSACVVAALRSGCLWGDRLFANRLMLWIGMMSYSLYLWHFPVMRALNIHAPGWLMEDALWRPLTVVTVVLIVSSLSFWFVERPLMRWRYRPGSRRG